MTRIRVPRSPEQTEPSGRSPHGNAIASPRSRRIAQLQTLSEASARAVAQRRVIDMVDHGARMTARDKASDQASDQAPDKASDNVSDKASVNANHTGLPDPLKRGIERLSGMSLDHVKVHYNSPQPAQLHAHAYAQGSEIHLAPGQERHLPHEAWHAVQQMQGRVAPTRQYAGVALNTSPDLEREADAMGARASQLSAGQGMPTPHSPPTGRTPAGAPVQRAFDAPHPSELALARRYVAALRPDLVSAFNRVDRDPRTETDLYDWLRANMGVTMHDVYDWDDGIVRGQPVRLGGEEVRGSRDIASDSDDEIDEFRIGLEEGEYSAGELVRMHHLLRLRDAPRDRERRELIVEHSAHRDGGAFRRAIFSDSDDDSDGTDTGGSDTEDDEAYDADDPTNEPHVTRTSDLLKPQLTLKRLDELGEAGRIDDPEAQDAALRKVMFEKATRPPRLFRKTAKFRHPSVSVGDRAKVPAKPTEAQMDDLAQLNALLQLGVPIAMAEQLVESRFVVAQYRGLFYSRKTFTGRKRARHRGLDETNRPVFASGALESSPLGIAGFYYLYGAGARQGALNAYLRLVDEHAQQIRQALLRLRSQPPSEAARKAVGRATDNFKPTSLADIGTHFYSQDYDAYHNALARSLRPGHEPSPLDPLFAGLTSKGNPKVSTGDVPTHAARYAYGLKPYEGHEDEVLDPEYAEDGTPRHPYSGQMYVSIHPLSDYDRDGPDQLVELQRQLRINIAQVILPERETPFEGLLGPGRVKHRMAAKFPDLRKPYKAVYAAKYGLSRALFNAFRKAMRGTEPGSDRRIFVEALLSNYLAMHAELKAVETAHELATGQGARLVYRTGPNSLGFEPSPLSGTSSDATPDWKALAGLLIGKMKRTAVKQGGGAPDNVVPISGNGFACYIRSLVTAAAVRYNLLPAHEVEAMVDTVQDHLGSVGLRQQGQAIDAGGLVAAEVRRVLAQLLNGFDPQIHIVTQTPDGLATYVANAGAMPVYLYYTPGHFDLLNQ